MLPCNLLEVATLLLNVAILRLIYVSPSMFHFLFLFFVTQISNSIDMQHEQEESDDEAIAAEEGSFALLQKRQKKVVHSMLQLDGLNVGGSASTNPTTNTYYEAFSRKRHEGVLSRRKLDASSRGHMGANLKRQVDAGRSRIVHVASTNA